MPLNLNDLMKKAKDKGITQNNERASSSLLRPWQQESILYNPPGQISRNKPENNERTTRDQQKGSLSNKENVCIGTREHPENNQGNNKRLIGEQSREQREINERSTRDQQGFIQRTIREQQENELESNKGSSREQLGSRLEINLGNDSGNESDEKMKFSLLNLIGHQKKLFDYAYELCSLRGELSTGFISTLEMAKTIGCSYDSAKVCIKRLIIKGLIKRLKGKGCRGGYINLEIPRTVKSIAINFKKINLPHFTGSDSDVGINPENKSGINPENESPYSSSSSYINTTTTAIDIEPLKNIGFYMSHLQQIIDQNKLDVEMIQNSIYAFAFDLEVNNKVKTIKISPLNYFMGILKQGRPYSPPTNYESPQNKAMRTYLERIKEANKQREEMEKALRELDFKEWEASLSEEDKDKLLPDEIRNQRMRAPKTSYIIQFHLENIWPPKRKELLLRFHVEHKN